MHTTPLNLTLRQLLESVNRAELLDILDVRCKPENRPGYEKVIDALLAKPRGAICHPILLAYFPESIWAKGTPEEFTDEEHVHVGLLNRHYVAPAEGLEPWYGDSDAEPPAGHFNTNASKHQETWGFGPTPWVELIAAPIVFHNEAGVRKLLPTNAHIAAEILWESTWNGWIESDQQAFWDSLRQQVDDIKAGRVETTPFDPEKPDPA